VLVAFDASDVVESLVAAMRQSGFANRFCAPDATVDIERRARVGCGFEPDAAAVTDDHTVHDGEGDFLAGPGGLADGRAASSRNLRDRTRVPRNRSSAKCPRFWPGFSDRRRRGSEAKDRSSSSYKNVRAVLVAPSPPHAVEGLAQPTKRHTSRSRRDQRHVFGANVSVLLVGQPGFVLCTGLRPDSQDVRFWWLVTGRAGAQWKVRQST
jgi:hypothetical protein